MQIIAAFCFLSHRMGRNDDDDDECTKFYTSDISDCDIYVATVLAQF